MDYTLLADGPSDIILMSPLDWLMHRHDIPLGNGRFADPWVLPGLSEGLSARIRAALREFPCDVLFIHRDAESASLEERKDEIHRALAEVNEDFRSVSVVPVRMTEAWFLFDEVAIRAASDNPNGTVPLNLPQRKRWESDVSPKDRLSEGLRRASELQGRRLARFNRNIGQRRRRVADYISDYSPLLDVPSFRELDNEIQSLSEKISAG